MKVEGAYPPPVLGVSTLAPRNRPIGCGGRQINMRSDRLAKLTKRPSLKWEHGHTQIHTDKLIHTVYRDEMEHLIVVREDGELFVGSSESGISSYPIAPEFKEYLGTPGKLLAATLGDETYIVNTAIRIKRNTLPTTAWNYTSHINVTSALNYGETIRLEIYMTGRTEAPAVITYTVPDIGDPPNYDVADKARATAAVATGLRNAINIAFMESSLIQAHSMGSAVKIKTMTPSVGEIVVRVASGQGAQSIKAFNTTIDSPDGLPRYASPGYIVRVRPNSQSDRGIYYLRATALSTPQPGDEMAEVSWTEWRARELAHQWDPTTLPVKVTTSRIGALPVRSFGRMTLRARQVGDDTSNPYPYFENREISVISTVQNRLVIVSDNTVCLSKTGEPDNFFRDSAVTLLTTDPTEIKSSATGIDKIRYAVPHNRALLLVASNAQFKLGEEPITPQTAGLPLVSAFETDISCSPIAMGSEVFLPVNYGTSAGIKKYGAEREKNQDNAISMSDHVIGYMPGRAKLLVGSASLGMIAMTTSESAPNEIFLLEFEGNRQMAWSTWTLPERSHVIYMFFREEQLNIVTRDPITGNLVTKSFSMYSNAASEHETVYLDDMVTVSVPSDTKQFQLPAHYPRDPDLVVVQGPGCRNPYTRALATIPPSGICTLEDYAFPASPPDTVTIYIGRLFKSEYEPTRPYVRDENGEPVTTTPLRVAKFYLDLVETDRVTSHIHSQYYEDDGVEFHSGQEFLARIVNGVGSLVGASPLYTGTEGFPFRMSADYGTIRFSSESHRNWTVAGISWMGQYHSTGRRL